jgi:hypothetical protein
MEAKDIHIQEMLPIWALIPEVQYWQKKGSFLSTNIYPFIPVQRCFSW